MWITKPQYETETKLKRIAFLSRSDRQKKFSILMHHFNERSLKESFMMIAGSKAAGADGINKERYKERLEENIKELLEKMKRMEYKPGPVKEVRIPKEGSQGETRALGISNLEDKIVQKMMQRILESIYEPIFLGSSYGFRPGRSCIEATREIHHQLYKEEIETVIDIDLANYFGSIDHTLLENILREKIKDEKMMRYIIRMFKAGVLAKGELIVSEEGVAQGSICSPILANIYAHYVLDQWIEEIVKPRCKGKVVLYRYCDDAVITCQYAQDAEKIKEVIGKRLEKYKLKLNIAKTKLVDFRKVDGKSASFDFLGFTHYLGKSRHGKIIPKLKTIGKRMRVKLKRVNEWAREIRSKMELTEIWKKFCLKIKGHIQYYSVSHNTRRVQAFVVQATWILYKWLNRRSQIRNFTWEKFTLFIKANPLPKVKVCHKLF